ncbi:12507_t:CDS:10, partial [Acaulospora morrowiae]
EHESDEEDTNAEEQEFDEFLNDHGEKNESHERDDEFSDDTIIADFDKSSDDMDHVDFDKPSESDKDDAQDSTHKNKRSLKEDVAEHKKQLDLLKEKDSEFYKYLQENDSELLNFDITDDSGSEDEDNEGNDTLKEAGLDDDTGTPTLTVEMITQWQESVVKTNSLKSLQRLLLAFRAAAHINDDDDEKPFAFKITDPTVFNNLIVVCLKSVTEVFDHHLKVKNQEVSKKNLLCTRRKWKTVEPLVKSYLSNLLYMLKQVTEDNMIYFIVKESEKAIPYYACNPKLAKHYLKQLLEIWGTAEDKTRIIAFLNIRKLASTAPPPFIDFCLKGIYTTFVRYCKDTTTFTIPSINLMSNCAVEIYGIDLKSSYQSAFGYIRQLAIHLRNSSNNKNEETFNAVYNWQYVHCIEYWSKVLAAYCDQQRVEVTGENSLRELIYPLVQVTTGVMRLNPAAQYFPFQFHCIRSLIHLIQKTGTFIPLAPYLFDVLHSSEVRRKPKPSTLKPLDFTSIIKAPKSYLHTRIYQDGICEELLELLFEYYSCFCLSIAFPELVIPPIIQIKRHIKNSKNLKINKQLQQLVEKLEQNSKYIEQHRSQTEISPNNHAQVKSFLRNVDPGETPLGAYVISSRKLREQRKKLLDL